MKRVEIDVTDVIDKRYREFSMYVLLQRAIPSMIDGFKPVQRKAFFAAQKIADKEKCKVATLGASLPMMCNYHHGEGSAQEAVVGMTQRFKNNFPIFEEHGSFGSRLIPENSAPRYIFVKTNKKLNQYFSDFDILPENSDPESPEPEFYLPLIPWVLVNGTKGIAVGFATDIQPRSVADLTEACKLVAKGKSIDHLPLTPSFPQFRGKVEIQGDKWFQVGLYTRRSATKVDIDDIPTGISREKYVIHLDKLIDQSKIIKWVDKCGRDRKDPNSISQFGFEITLPRSSKDMPTDKLESMLKLRKSVSENLTVVGPDGNLRIYKRVHDLIKDFVEFRLTFYPTRYARLIKNANAKLRYLAARMKFIQMVNDNELILKGKNKKTLRKELNLIFATDVIEKLMSLHIYSLCIDEIEILSKEIKTITKDIERWKVIDHKKEYVKEIS